MYAIGLDLGGTNIKSGLVHKTDGIIANNSSPTNAQNGLESTLTTLTKAIKELQYHSDNDICGVGIGAPGMISYDRKTVHNPPNLPGWDVVPLADELTKRTGLPVLLENDANLMALGSARFGSGKIHDNFIMITLGTGVGGGIIYQNQIFRGVTGAAGELGHVTIDYNGRRCNSSVTGAIEGYLGQRFLSSIAVENILNYPDNELFKAFTGKFETLEPLHLTNAAEKGNTLAIEILHDAGKQLGFALVNYIHILDIRKIIVSGGVSKAGKWILDAAYETAMQQLMPPFKTDFEIIVESLGNEAAVLGAASLALDNF